MNAVTIAARKGAITAMIAGMTDTTVGMIVTDVEPSPKSGFFRLNRKNAIFHPWQNLVIFGLTVSPALLSPRPKIFSAH